MRAAIEYIAYHLPGNVVTNRDLQDENPDWDMDQVAERSGVFRRHIADPSATALDLAVAACDELFAARPEERERVDALVFCTQSADYIMPPNSSLLHAALGLGEGVFALDVNLACSGFVYSLGVAQGLVSAGIGSRVLLVNADTYSKFINAKDRSARSIFSDGASATLVGASAGGNGVVDLQCGTAGKHHDKFIIPAGGCRQPRTGETAVAEVDKSGNLRSRDDIHMDGLGILTFVNSKIPRQVKGLLKRNDMELQDVDLFVFHQASRMALDSLARLLKLDADKVYSNIGEIGNTVSASIPIALSDAMRDGKVGRGDRVLLAGFGVGLSWGTALVEL